MPETGQANTLKTKGNSMKCRQLAALAQDNVFKIGLTLPMTGQQATTGRQIEAAARLYMAQHGDSVAGKAR
jgi:branched-chain amino acid transport system substrate-binding protein